MLYQVVFYRGKSEFYHPGELRENVKYTPRFTPSKQARKLGYVSANSLGDIG